MRSVSRLVNGTYSGEGESVEGESSVRARKGKSESTARGNKMMRGGGGVEDGLSASCEREEVETLADLAILTQATYGSRNDGVICALCTPVVLRNHETFRFARERLPERDKFKQTR